MERARRPWLRRTDLVVAVTALLAGAAGAISALTILHATLGRNLTTPAVTGRPAPDPGTGRPPVRPVVLDRAPLPGR